MIANYEIVTESALHAEISYVSGCDRKFTS
jgi:hypothetical protein